MDNPKDIAQKNNTKKDKVYWHDAFYAALQLELHRYRNALIFEDEYQLSKQALKMDVLIIKKKANIKINKNIGVIFKKHNIFEFKSESDYLSIRDYNKVLGYALLYSSFKAVFIEDITVSFVVNPKPKKLLNYLTNVRKLEIDEISSSIYYIKGDIFNVQIIESKKLSAKENIFLRNMRSDLTKKELHGVFSAYRKYGSLEKVNIYLNRVVDANASIVKEVIGMLNPMLREILREYLEEDLADDSVRNRYLERYGTVDKLKREERENVKRETALKMLKDNLPAYKVSEYTEMPIEWVQGLTP